MKTKGDFWLWLENRFVSNLRAQQWYNKDQPIHLNGYLNDRTNRLVGWTMMKQLRIRSHQCSQKSIQSECKDDFDQSNEETRSFRLQWLNQTDINLKSIMLKKLFNM